MRKTKTKTAAPSIPVPRLEGELAAMFREAYDQMAAVQRDIGAHRSEYLIREAAMMARARAVSTELHSVVTRAAAAAGIAGSVDVDPVTLEIVRR